MQNTFRIIEKATAPKLSPTATGVLTLLIYKSASLATHPTPPLQAPTCASQPILLEAFSPRNGSA